METAVRYLAERENNPQTELQRMARQSKQPDPETLSTRRRPRSCSATGTSSGSTSTKRDGYVGAIYFERCAKWAWLEAVALPCGPST